MHYTKPVFAIIIIFFIAGCSSSKPVVFDSNSNIDPVQFFIGNTASSGVIEKAGGKPTAVVTTKTHGTLKDDMITIEQELYQGEKKNHRSWKLHKLDAKHIEATATGIEGTAHGLLKGNTFTWTFRLKLSNNKFIKHVRMTQYMYVMPGGQTMIIRSIIRKFGFKVAQITEEFRRE